MIGNNHHPARGWNTFQFVITHRVAEFEIIQNLLNKFDALQMRILLGKGNKVLFVQQMLEGAGDWFF